MARVAIIVITFNSGLEIGPCLTALAGITNAEVLVVDNASTDRTRQSVNAMGTRLIANDTNLGFAAAVNQAVRATTSTLLLLLNPDAILESGLEALICEFDDPRMGAAGGLLKGPDGRPQEGFIFRNLPSPEALILEVLGINKLWPRNPVNWHYRCLERDSGIRQAVDQPAGAFLMFTRSAWQRVGGFDERFWPVWFEDVDFCARLKRAGFQVYFNPVAVAKHQGGHSVAALPLEKKERYWYGSLLEYAAKHYHSPSYKAVCLAVAVSAVFRAFVTFPRDGWRVFAVYGAVCRFALGRLFRLRRGSERVVSSEWRENS